MDSAVSAIGLFGQAGLVGKSVIGLLLAASVWCWIVLIETGIGAWRLAAMVKRARAGTVESPVQELLDRGAGEAAVAIPGETSGERRIRVAEALQRWALGLAAPAEARLSSLAVISTVAPFVGLFGTVWGIMSSFAAIGDANDTSLAVVAPGIAEALATTAFGLAAAIPATFGYHKIGDSLARSTRQLSSFLDDRATTLLREVQLT